MLGMLVIFEQSLWDDFIKSQIADLKLELWFWNMIMGYFEPSLNRLCETIWVRLRSVFFISMRRFGENPIVWLTSRSKKNAWTSISDCTYIFETLDYTETVLKRRFHYNPNGDLSRAIDTDVRLCGCQSAHLIVFMRRFGETLKYLYFYF